MNLIANPASSLSGEVESPPSKLHTQLACALAILTEGKSTIDSPLRVKDTNVMLNAAEVLGATVKRTHERWSIWGVGGSLKPLQNVVDAKNSGTALGLLASIATIAQTPIVLNGDAQLRSRPMPNLLRALRRLGADINSTKPDDSPPFIVYGGGLKGGKVNLNDVEARHLPATLITSPYAKKEVQVSFDPDEISPQLESTLELMKTARAKMNERKGKLSFQCRPYRAFNYDVKREAAGAAPFIVAAGLVASKVKVRGMDGNSTRDSAFLQALKSIGLSLHATRKSVEVGGRHRLKGTRLDMSWAPELLPLMAVLACRAKGKTIIQDAAEARRMKSDRISSISQELRRMRAKVLEQNDGLVVQGPAELKGCEVDCHDDYAIASALAVAGLVASGKTVIKGGADALGTSYSRFVSTFQSLGAEMSYGS